jgi:hypothetical protein
MFKFERLDVWQSAMELYELVAAADSEALLADAAAFVSTIQGLVSTPTP